MEALQMLSTGGIIEWTVTVTSNTAYYQLSWKKNCTVPIEIKEHNHYMKHDKTKKNT